MAESGDPEAITFRSMERADIEGGLNLCRAARWNQLESDWSAFLTANPGGSRVAEKSGQIVGTSATIRYGDRFSWIGMVLVDPKERGRGIGTEMLLQALAVLSDQACIRLDATPAGEPIYRKFGFAEEYWLDRMEFREPVGLDTQTSRPMDELSFAEVRRLDLEVFGADRSLLLEWIREVAPEYARVVVSGDRLRGYMFGRHGFNFEHLGPVVALDAGAAIELVGSCLAKLKGKRVILDTPRKPGRWADWLAQAGFSEQRPFLRMCKGRLDHPGRLDLQYAILGPEFG